MEKKHTRNFSLDVHPYMLTIRKPKVEATIVAPLPSAHNIDAVYLEGTHSIVHVSGAITGQPHLYSSLASFYCALHTRTSWAIIILFLSLLPCLILPSCLFSD